MTIEQLKADRHELTEQLLYCDLDAFPGTPEWWALEKVERAISAFDKLHPEVLAANQMERHERIRRENPTMDFN